MKWELEWEFNDTHDLLLHLNQYVEDHSDYTLWYSFDDEGHGKIMFHLLTKKSMDKKYKEGKI